MQNFNPNVSPWPPCPPFIGTVSVQVGRVELKERSLTGHPSNMLGQRGFGRSGRLCMAEWSHNVIRCPSNMEGNRSKQKLQEHHGPAFELGSPWLCTPLPQFQVLFVTAATHCPPVKRAKKQVSSKEGQGHGIVVRWTSLSTC